jgi:hypothetical protein
MLKQTALVCYWLLVHGIRAVPILEALQDQETAARSFAPRQAAALAEERAPSAVIGSPGGAVGAIANTEYDTQADREDAAHVVRVTGAVSEPRDVDGSVFAPVVGPSDAAYAATSHWNGAVEAVPDYLKSFDTAPRLLISVGFVSVAGGDSQYVPLQPVEEPDSGVYTPGNMPIPKGEGVG